MQITYDVSNAFYSSNNSDNCDSTSSSVSSSRPSNRVTLNSRPNDDDDEGEGAIGVGQAKKFADHTCYIQLNKMILGFPFFAFFQTKIALPLMLAAF